MIFGLTKLGLVERSEHRYDRINVEIHVSNFIENSPTHVTRWYCPAFRLRSNKIQFILNQSEAWSASQIHEMVLFHSIENLEQILVVWHWQLKTYREEGILAIWG